MIFQPRHRILLRAFIMGVFLVPAIVASAFEAEHYCAAQHASARRSFDVTNGVDPRQYPPDFPVDFSHMLLRLRFDDLNTKSFSGQAHLTFRPKKTGITLLTLDAVDLDIDRVTNVAGRKIRFDHDAEKLILHFATPLPIESDSTIIVHYRCVDPVEGMTFVLPDDGSPNRPSVVHTQGETDTSRYWFPCLDAPQDRLVTEMIVTVPKPYVALSNGALLDKKNENAGHTTYHWKQAVPHVFYLVTLVIGEFDVYENQWRDIPVNVHVPKGRIADAKRTYSRTPDMIEYFSNITGVDYPYEKYAQILVPRFKFGGMENTTATTLVDLALMDETAAIDNDNDGLIAHELAHQWYGDLITCRSWPHTWLNEGFATFFQSMWTEHHEGRDAYLYEFRNRYTGLVSSDRTDKPGAIVLYRYSQTFEPFFHKGSLAYSKGACVLHMLRSQLGDDVFWNGIRRYTRTFRETQVETDQLRRVFEEVSGQNLEQFFEQWVYRPGLPHLKVSYRWLADDGVAQIDIEQEQPITEAVPAFAFPLEIQFVSGDGEVITDVVQVSERKTTHRRDFDAPPRMAMIDPHLKVLKKLTCDKPRPMWLAQLAEGPTSISRIVAATHLVSHDRPEVIDALEQTTGDASLHWSVRGEASKALGKMQSPRAMNALIKLLDDRIADHRTRERVVNALAEYRDATAIATIKPLATSDPSYNVTAAATSALAKMRAKDVADILITNAGRDSYWDRLRLTSLRSLADLRDPDGIDVIRKYTAPGHHERTRQVAIESLGRYGTRDEQRDDIREFIIPFLNDPLEWARIGSINGLATIGDGPSRAAIAKRIAGAATERVRMAAKNALRRIDQKSTDSETIDALGEEVRAVREKLSELQSQFKDRK